MSFFEPVILFFLLGAIAGLVRSDLKIPGVLAEAYARRCMAMPDFEPVILFFLLGAFAGFVRSDLKIPDVLYESLSIFCCSPSA